MGHIRTRSSDIKKRLAERRKQRKAENEDSDHTPKDGTRGKSDLLAKKEVSDEGVDITRWPTRSEASKHSGISKSTIIRLQHSGDLEAVQDSQGNWRFNPDDLDAIAETRTSEAATMMTETIGVVVKVSQEQTASAQENATAFAELQLQQSEMSFTQMREMCETLVDQMKNQVEYIRFLETERRENVKEIDKAQTKVHERDLEAYKERRLDDRIDWALKTVVAIAGPSILLKLGLNPATGAAIPTTDNTIGALLAKKEDGSTPKTVGDEITIEKLEELNLSAILLIANIDEARFKLLCHVATPEEVAALTEVRETVATIRKNKKVEL